MALGTQKSIIQVQWFWVFAVVAGITFLFLDIFLFTEEARFLYKVSVSFLAFTILLGTFIVILLLYQILRHLNTNTHLLRKIADSTTKSIESLTSISHDVRLSDDVKRISFQDLSRLSLGEAVLSKLHQKDFNATYNLISAIEEKTEFQNLAKKLRAAADKYKNATETERIEQVIAHIEGLCEEQHWQQAAAQTQRLQKACPDSEIVKALPERLRKLKEDKKRELLKEWQAATSSGDTEKSLIILKELDSYLTPSEGLALQESASGVFRAKLQSLGVSFSLAVSDGNWKNALTVGEEIVRDFPNSKMAHEILSKIDVLKEKAKEKE